jgi:hypothetical protein
MAFRSWLLVFACLAFGAPAIAREPPARLEYRCGDLVAVARLKVVEETDVEDDFFMSHWRSERRLQLQVDRIIHGSETRPVVEARMISHAQPREDEDMLMVLAPRADGVYEVRQLALWDDRPKPRLTEPCSLQTK